MSERKQPDFFLGSKMLFRLQSNPFSTPKTKFLRSNIRILVAHLLFLICEAKQREQMIWPQKFNFGNQTSLVQNLLFTPKTWSLGVKSKFWKRNGQEDANLGTGMEK